MVTAPGANVSGVRLAGGAHVVLGPVLAKAGEGTIYAVADRPTWVAKVFHPTLSDLAAKVDKVAAMIGAPPPGAIQQDGFVVLAWPMNLLESDRGAVGYVMPRIDTATAVEIHTLSNPSNRANPLPTAPQWPKGATWSHLVNVAANLCVAVEAAHRVDAVIGDFQERNILVADTTRVTLVDCDSMQFSNASGRQFLCGVGRPEFTAPELATANLRTQARDEPSDLFALAVHIHLLLMAGNHPFLRGGWTGAGDQPDALTLAAAGHWAGGWQSPLHTHPLAPPVSFLPADIQHLFLRAFTTGAHDPTLRPTATEWRTTLLRIQTTPCPQGTHHIPTGCTTCPWCAITTERQARKVSSGAAAIGTRAARPPSRRGAEARTATATVRTAAPRRPTAKTNGPTTRSRLIVLTLVAAVVAVGGLVWALAHSAENPGSRSTASTASPVDSSVPAPILESPPDGAALTSHPRTIQFAWDPVKGATGYELDVNFEFEGSRTQDVVSSIDGGVTSYSFDSSVSIGARGGLWRVTARNDAHRLGTPSEWRTFTYTP